MQSRRDDLESLAYVLIYFLCGSLPWQRLDGRTKKQKFNRIFQRKARVPIAELCSSLPTEFHLFLEYTRNLAFDDTPDYHYLQTLLHDAFNHAGYVDDGFFDWTAKLPTNNLVGASSSFLTTTAKSQTVSDSNW